MCSCQPFLCAFPFYKVPTFHTYSFGFVWIYFDAQEGTLDRVYGRDTMRPGRYSVELYLNGVYQNVGYFTIR